VGKPEGMRPPERLTRRWYNNIKMDARGTGWAGINWIDMTQNRDQWRAPLNTATKLWAP
jgi:hypothetical protein